MLSVLKKEFRVNIMSLLIYPLIIFLNFHNQANVTLICRSVIGLVLISLFISFWMERYYRFDTIIDKLPVKKSEIVAGKYIYFLCLPSMIIGLCIALSLVQTGSIVNVDMLDAFLVTVLEAAIFMPVIYLCFPRVWICYIFSALSVVITQVLLEFVKSNSSWIIFSNVPLKIALVTIALYISYLASTALYKKKDIS